MTLIIYTKLFFGPLDFFSFSVHNFNAEAPAPLILYPSCKMLLSNDKFLVRPTHSLQIGINSKSDTEQDLDSIEALWLAS